MKPKILLLFTFIMLLTTAFATDPWGDPVVLPGSMTVMAQVFINGMPASSNDVLAAMVEIAGTPELRGKATIQNINGVAGCLIQIFTESNGEIIHFKVWDESAQTIFNVSQTLNSEVNGSVGSYPDNMYQIFAGSNMIVDPWTAPSILTNSMTVLSQVGISGNPTESNDILAAFVSVNGQLELRGKQQISIVNGISGCLIQIFTETNGEQVQFKIWDYSEQEIISCTTTLLTEVQGMVGS
jgi:L-aminopeptidase/D-esterase-like protein